MKDVLSGVRVGAGFLVFLTLEAQDVAALLDASAQRVSEATMPGDMFCLFFPRELMAHTAMRESVPPKVALD